MAGKRCDGARRRTCEVVDWITIPQHHSNELRSTAEKWPKVEVLGREWELRWKETCPKHKIFTGTMKIGSM
jgi:hypothetical protein